MKRVSSGPREGRTDGRTGRRREGLGFFLLVRFVLGVFLGGGGRGGWKGGDDLELVGD